MSGESLLIILLVGLIAGWLASHVVSGTGHGLIADLCIGVVGALIGNWLLPKVGLRLGTGTGFSLTSIISATIGAVILLLILRLLRPRRRWF